MLPNITGKHKVCGVIGKPINHTLSPLIHNTFNEHLGQQMVYVPFYVEETELEEAIKGAHALGIRGLNVTMPHKQDVMKWLEDIDEDAKRVHAVNTLVYTEKGYRGYNTDVWGLGQSMKEAGIEYKGQNVAIIGSGGAAYAAMQCIAREAKSIYLFNRTLKKAEVLKQHFLEYTKAPIHVYSLEEQGIEEIDLVIQTTGMGMGEYKDQMPACAPCLLTQAKYAVDMIYNPWETAFLKEAKSQGCQCINGFGMLFYQAVRAYELMNNWNYDEKVIKEVKETLNTLMK